MPYSIHINQLVLDLIVGIHPHERENKQTIYLDLIATPRNQNAGQSDEIEETINYQTLAQTIKHTAEASQFFLLEKLGEHLIDTLIKEPQFSFKFIQLTLSKTEIQPTAHSYAVTVSRQID